MIYLFNAIIIMSAAARPRLLSTLTPSLTTCDAKLSTLTPSVKLNLFIGDIHLDDLCAKLDATVVEASGEASAPLNSGKSQNRMNLMNLLFVHFDAEFLCDRTYFPHML